jgi:glucose-6-phosphate-specific signal transduction histidine kinase
MTQIQIKLIKGLFVFYIIMLMLWGFAFLSLSNNNDGEMGASLLFDGLFFSGIYLLFAFIWTFYLKKNITTMNNIHRKNHLRLYGIHCIVILILILIALIIILLPPIYPSTPYDGAVQIHEN